MRTSFNSNNPSLILQFSDNSFNPANKTMIQSKQFTGALVSIQPSKHVQSASAGFIDVPITVSTADNVTLIDEQEDQVVTLATARRNLCKRQLPNLWAAIVQTQKQTAALLCLIAVLLVCGAFFLLHFKRVEIVQVIYGNQHATQHDDATPQPNFKPMNQESVHATDNNNNKEVLSNSTKVPPALHSDNLNQPFEYNTTETVFHTSQYGGNGGSPFSGEMAYKKAGPITGFDVWLGSPVADLSLQAMHGSYYDDRRGCAYGSKTSFSLAAGDVITEATVTYGTYICSLSFRTASSTVLGPYKSARECIHSNTSVNTVTVHMGRLLYITGRSGSWLDSIAFAYSN